MEEELNTNIPDSATTTEAEVDNKSTEPFKSFATEEEFKKAIQSERSKAKGEILKELGVSSVNDFNTLKSKYEDAIKDKDTINNNMTKLESDFKALQEKNILLELNVDDKYADDTLTLARTRVSETTDLKTAVEEILTKNPNWKSQTSAIKFGIDKSDSEAESPEETTRRNILSKLGI